MGWKFTGHYELHGCMPSINDNIDLTRCPWQMHTHFYRDNFCQYILCIFNEMPLEWVMAWCHQATSHYLSQSWSRSKWPYGITRPQWVNILKLTPFRRWYFQCEKTTGNQIKGKPMSLSYMLVLFPEVQNPIKGIYDMISWLMERHCLVMCEH